MAAALAPMPGETPAQDPLSQVVPGKADMGDDYDAIVVQMTQLMEHSDPAQKPPWDGSGLPETVAEMQALDAEDLKRKESITDSRAYHKIKLWGKPLEPRDLTETLGQRRPSRRLRLARGSEPASVPFSRNALYYLSQEKRGSSTCLKSKLEELEDYEASSSKGRMRAQRRRLATC